MSRAAPKLAALDWPVVSLGLAGLGLWRKGSYRWLPEDGSRVLGYRRVGRHDGHVVEDGLGNKTAIKRVWVKGRQQRVVHC